MIRDFALKKTIAAGENFSHRR